MDIERIREFCLSLSFAAGDMKRKKDLTFCVGGKMFAVVVLDPDVCVMSFKRTPEKYAELTERPG